MEFYFDIKSRTNDEWGKWMWPPVWSGRITADDSKQARKLIEAEYDRKFIMKDGVRVKEEPFLLSIKEMTPYLLKRFEIKKCEICGTEYTLNEAYITGSNGRFCSTECSEIYTINQNSNYGTEYSSFYQNQYLNPPVIYRITDKRNQMVYIGKSTQSVTLRWWQHIKSGMLSKGVTNPKLTKFYKSISESELSDWIFEVIEVIEFPEDVVSNIDRNKYILGRESYYINKHDSIVNGYNTVVSLKETGTEMKEEEETF